MLALKILSTIFISISAITALFKNAAVGDDSVLGFFVIMMYSWGWRTLVITTIWLI